MFGNDLVIFILLALSTWRLSSLVVNEDGFMDIFLRFRMRLGVKYNFDNRDITNMDEVVGLRIDFPRIEFEDIDRYANNTLARLVNCVWCTSIWVGVFYALLYFIGMHNLLIKDIFNYYNLAMSLSAFAIIVESKV